MQTLATMRQLVRQDAPHPIIRDWAIGIIRGFHLGAPLNLADGIRAWVNMFCLIVSEPEEILRRPLYMVSEALQTGQTSGDCDDVSMLGATFFVALGYQARFCAIRPNVDGSMQHVFLHWCVDGFRWNALDLSWHGIPSYNPRESIIMEV